MEFRVIESVWELQKELNALRRIVKNQKQNNHPIDYLCDNAHKHFKNAFEELKEGNSRKEFFFSIFNEYKSFLEYVFNNANLDKSTALNVFSTYRKTTHKAQELLNSLSENSHLFNQTKKCEVYEKFKNNSVNSLKALLKNSDLYLTTENDVKYLLNSFEKNDNFCKE